MEKRFSEFSDEVKVDQSLETLFMAQISMLTNICSDLLLAPCLNSSDTLLKSLLKVFATCTIFVSHLQRLEELQIGPSLRDVSFMEFIRETTQTFDEQVRKFFREMQDNNRESRSSNEKLIDILDFDGFYIDSNSE